MKRYLDLPHSFEALQERQQRPHGQPIRCEGAVVHSQREGHQVGGTTSRALDTREHICTNAVVNGETEGDIEGDEGGGQGEPGNDGGDTVFAFAAYPK
jgi:hypothetical protein